MQLRAWKYYKGSKKLCFLATKSFFLRDAEIYRFTFSRNVECKLSKESKYSFRNLRDTTVGKVCSNCKF
jgi:hypothetical protein